MQDEIFLRQDSEFWVVESTETVVSWFGYLRKKTSNIFVVSIHPVAGPAAFELAYKVAKKIAEERGAIFELSPRASKEYARLQISETRENAMTMVEA